MRISKLKPVLCKTENPIFLYLSYQILRMSRKNHECNNNKFLCCLQYRGFSNSKIFFCRQTGSYDAIDGSGDHQKIPTEPSYLAPCKENQQKYSELSKMASTDPHSNHSSPSTSSQKAPTLITFSPPSFEQKINSSTMVSVFFPFLFLN